MDVNDVARRRGPPVLGRKRKFRSLNDVINEESAAERGRRRRRNWAELETDCLSFVFARIGMESLLLGVPFVCKSWHKASLNLICYQSLSFPEYIPFLDHYSDKGFSQEEQFYAKFVNKGFSISGFVEMVVARSKGNAVEIKLPGFIDEGVLRFVAEECPGLRVLSLPDDVVVFKHTRVLGEVIGKWKLLEELHLGGNLKKMDSLRGKMDAQVTKQVFAIGDNCGCEFLLEEIIKQIGMNCKHFVGLRIAHAYVSQVEASTIVKWLPCLKYLWLQESYLEGGVDSLCALVRGCMKLEVLDVSDCEGVEEGGSDVREIADLAAGKGIEFQCRGCVVDNVCFGRCVQQELRMMLLRKVRARLSPRMSTSGGFAFMGKLLVGRL